MKFLKKISFLTSVLLTVNYLNAQIPINFKFDFGSGKVEKGYTHVLSSMSYNDEKGFGFDYGTMPLDCKRKGKSALNSDFVTSHKPFYFSVAVPEGNYKIKVTMGDSEGESETIVRGESRRLFIEDCKTQKGEFITRTFSINVRTPKINDSLAIKIKPREKGYLNWDNKLTLEFNGPKPTVCSIEITKDDELITVFLAGNSTVTDQEQEPWASWGQMIPRFLDDEICVANYAESGESLSSSKASKRLDKILHLLKPGDYVFIEFGHNDQKQKGEGKGPWTSYKKELLDFVTAIRSKGGNPVIVTSVSRRHFDSIGHIINTLGDYPAAARNVAEETKTPLIDLNKMTKVLYEAWGPEKSVKGFVHYPANTFPGQDKALADNTHFNTYGAYEIAKCVLQGVKDINLDLADYISKHFTGFDPAKPDSVELWVWPLSPMVSNVKPDGN